MTSSTFSLKTLQRLTCAVLLTAAHAANHLTTAHAANHRRVVHWLVPYDNLTTTAQYASMWGQLAAAHRPNQSFYAASAYALKLNGSLGYASTSAGEATGGAQMESLGFPALRSLGLGGSLLGMVYVTHESAIIKMTANPEPFINQLLAKAEEQQLFGYDVDFEPQQVTAGGVRDVRLMAFFEKLAAGLAAQGRVLTVDIGPGCPTSSGFECAGLGSNTSYIPGLLQVNTEDTFGASGVSSMQAAQAQDGGVDALGARWAPGFEPGNVGEAAFGQMLQWLGSPTACSGGVCPQAISTWAFHEWNVGPQPTWLLDTISTFLDGG